MKKFLLLATLVAHGISAQIISKDQTFANNGIYSMTENMAWSQIVQNSDGSIFLLMIKQMLQPGLGILIYLRLL